MLEQHRKQIMNDLSPAAAGLMTSAFIKHQEHHAPPSDNFVEIASAVTCGILEALTTMYSLGYRIVPPPTPERTEIPEDIRTALKGLLEAVPTAGIFEVNLVTGQTRRIDPDGNAISESVEPAPSPEEETPDAGAQPDQ